MSIAFVSHASACEILRVCGDAGVRWPKPARMLPVWGDCVHGQREMARLEGEVDLKKLGLETKPVDVLVPASDYRSRGKHLCTHVWARVIPPESMRRVHPRVVVSGPEFVLLQLSRVHNMHWPQYEAVSDRYLEERDLILRYGLGGEAKVQPPLLWEPVRSIVCVTRVAMEFLGTYRLGAPGEEATFGARPLTTMKAAREFAASVRDYRAQGNMVRALDLVVENSGSPRETALTLMLTLPPEMGGYGLLRPELNALLDAPPAWYDISGDHYIMPDLLWRDHRLVVEYYGHKSHRGQGVQKTDLDMMRANMLRTMGYSVIEVTAGVVDTLPRMDHLAGELASLMGQTLAEVDEDTSMLRRHLYEELFRE